MKKKRESADDELQASPSSSSSTGTASRPDLLPTNSAARRKLSLIEVSRASWSSHDSVEILRREPTAAEEQQVRLNGDILDEFELMDHGYEAVVTTSGKRLSVPDANYETLRPRSQAAAAAAAVVVVAGSGTTVAAASSRNGVDPMPIYSLPFKHRQVGLV